MQRALALPSGEAAHAEFARLLAAWDKLAHPTWSVPATEDPEMKDYYDDLLERRRVILHVVNRLWAQTGHAFLQEFVKRLRDDYRAPLGALDFHEEAEQARVAINKWVADATEQRIEELIARGQITSDTKLVLTNAVYFKAHWTEEFELSATQAAPFFLAGGKKTKTPLMRRVGFYQLARLDGGMLLELPYGDGSLVMDVALPTAKDGLARVEDLYVKSGLQPWLRSLGLAHVDVMLPRFQTSSSFELSETLSALGMPKAFHYPGADFSGIDGTHDLFIARVVHQAFVDVDENVTEAAAATTVVSEVLESEAEMETPVVFRADHPFLFFVRDTQTGAMLFVGRLADPSAS
jgi:serpin B